MKTLRIFGLILLAISSCLSACGEIENPIEPTPDPKPEEVKSEITIDADITTNGLSFTSDKGEKSISFTTNEDWTLSIAATPSGDAWCSASTTNGAKGNANVKFSVTENTSYDDRSVSVTIKSGTASKTFTITQKYAEALLLTTNKYELSQDGGTIEIEVKANIDYEMEIAESAKDWITEAKTRALTTYKHTLTIATNEEVEKREGEIYFKSGDKVETVKIYQEGAEAIIILSQKEYTVSDAGETISVDIKSNIEYDVQMPDVDWISAETSTRSLSSHTLKYIISPNEGYDSRTAEIIFYDKNSELKDTVKIVQVQKDAIIVAQNEYIVNSDGSNLEFEVSTNVDFEVTTSVDWIKQNVETRSLDSKPLSFTIEDNTAETDREGLIIISYGELKQEIKVIQQRKVYFRFSTTTVNVESDETEFNIEVSTNGGYIIIMPEVDWLTQGESYKTHTNTYNNSFFLDINTTYDSRETEIKFKNTWTNEIVLVKVIQSQKDAIILSQKTYDVSGNGEVITIELSSNVEFDVTIPEVDWITLVTTRALQEHTLHFNIAENTGFEDRSAEIIFTNEERQISDTVSVHQGSSLEAGYEDGIVTVTTAGTMKSLLGKDYLNITSLKVIGYLNGDDIYYLRKMLGGSDFSEANRGILSTLDLSEAIIVEGGEYYFMDYSSKQYHTFNNVVGDFMFYKCNNLQNIILPSNAQSIGESAFFFCPALTSVTIGDNVTSIGESAFSCSSLTSIIIPDNVTSIDKSAFRGCSALTSITIGKGVTSIKERTFEGSALVSIDIPDNISWIGSYAFESCPTLTTVCIGNGVTSIGECAFSECTALASITIGSGVTTIGERAFFKCPALTSVIIPDNVTKIPKEAFYKCVALTSVTIGNGVTSIKDNAFEKCSALTNVSIGNSVTSIGKQVFFDCTTLPSIVIPDNVTSISNSAFENCSSLSSVRLGNGLKSIAYKTFANCSSLTSIIIPDNVSGIGEKAFYECSALTSVSIGSGVGAIGGYAFDKCSALEECYCYATTPPKFSKDTYGFTINPFSLAIKNSAILYIPARCETAYLNSKWSECFSNIKEID